MVFRTYNDSLAVTKDYRKLHDFLVQTGNREFTYARFDWMMTNRDYLEVQYVKHIGLWEEKGKLVAAVLFDHTMDVTVPLTLPGFDFLYPQMVDYAKKHMTKPEQPFLVYAGDENGALQAVLQKLGMKKTTKREHTAIFDLSEKIKERPLKAGYRLTDLLENRDFEGYLHCLFRGFDHEANGEIFSFCEEKTTLAYEREYVDLRLKISVVDAQGQHIAHAGMWYDSKAEFALVEPVCTVPRMRGQGFGAAALTEGLRRVKALGAKYAVVGADQPFYYALGFVPCASGTIWK